MLQRLVFLQLANLYFPGGFAAGAYCLDGKEVGKAAFEPKSVIRPPTWVEADRASVNVGRTAEAYTYVATYANGRKAGGKTGTRLCI